MADQNAAIKIAEADTKKKITRAVNKKFSKTQVVERPFFLDEGGMDRYHHGFMAVLKVIIGLIYIPIVLIAGITEGIEVGFLAGLKKAEGMYEGFLK